MSPKVDGTTLDRATRERTLTPGFRDFLNSSAGSKIAACIAAVFILVTGYLVYRSLFVNEVNELFLNDRVYICSETGKAFQVDLKAGMMTPVYSSASGKNTGYPAEYCYWTKDGQIKKDPTYVLLNTYVGKKGPTICQDCGRVVSPMNPLPQSGDKPPPTEREAKLPRPEQ